MNSTPSSWSAAGALRSGAPSYGLNACGDRAASSSTGRRARAAFASGVAGRRPARVARRSRTSRARGGTPVMFSIAVNSGMRSARRGRCRHDVPFGRRCGCPSRGSSSSAAVHPYGAPTKSRSCQGRRSRRGTALSWVHGRVRSCCLSAQRMGLVRARRGTFRRRDTSHQTGRGRRRRGHLGRSALSSVRRPPSRHSCSAARQRSKSSLRQRSRLMVAVGFGGGLAPVLLVLALARTPAGTVSLFFNLELARPRSSPVPSSKSTSVAVPGSGSSSSCWRRDPRRHLGSGSRGRRMLVAPPACAGASTTPSPPASTATARHRSRSPRASSPVRSTSSWASGSRRPRAGSSSLPSRSGRSATACRSPCGSPAPDSSAPHGSSHLRPRPVHRSAPRVADQRRPPHVDDPRRVHGVARRRPRRGQPAHHRQRPHPRSSSSTRTRSTPSDPDRWALWLMVMLPFGCGGCRGRSGGCGRA